MPGAVAEAPYLCEVQGPKQSCCLGAHAYALQPGAKAHLCLAPNQNNIVLAAGFLIKKTGQKMLFCALCFPFLK